LSIRGKIGEISPSKAWALSGWMGAIPVLPDTATLLVWIMICGWDLLPKKPFNGIGSFYFMVIGLCRGTNDGLGQCILWIMPIWMKGPIRQNR